MITVLIYRKYDKLNYQTGNVCYLKNKNEIYKLQDCYIENCPLYNIT